MAAETQYTANTAMATISTANSALDGTGAVTVLTAGASPGTLVKSVTIKATGNTTQGMVRLFMYDGTNTRLVAEVEIPAVTKGANDPAFEVRLDTNFALKAANVLKATTENAESFNIIAEGLDWAYYASSVRPESTKFTANTGMANITTANTSLTGSGTINTDMWEVLTAASSGTEITSVTVKGIVNTTAGMIRLFLYDGTNTKLLTEIPVEATTKSASAHAFSKRITFGGSGFALKSAWRLRATTEKSETFNVIAEGLDWTYPA